MFIIPLSGKLSWRNPPIVTLAVILINCLVWFVFQAGDTQRQYSLSEFYFNSGLADIEVSRYIAYREGRLDELAESTGDHEQLDEETLVRFFIEMQRDARFLKKLENDEIITPSDPQYAEWKELRTVYESKRSRLTSFNYGFIPAKKSFLTSVTHMFMHGSTGHLIGNMIFLWIVGCMLEMGLGRLRYSFLYILGGLSAVWVFWLIYMNSDTPLVGASGAIAGLMGAFAVLFGRKMVKIFYSLGFYFNYLRIPAIILLPIWMGNEFFQLFFGGASHVAYVAHIGGLIGGALFGFICLKFSLGFDRDVIEDAPVDETAPLIEKALKHIAELDMESGRQLLEKVLAIEPENIDALTHLFNVYKLNPDDEKFHEVTKKLIIGLTGSYNTYEKAHDIYQEYIRHTNHARLTPQLYIQLSIMFAATGHLENAVKIITMLLKKVPDAPGVSTALLKLAWAYDQKGMAAKGHKCLQLICSKYPESIEAQVARKSLQN
jgi:membrane associated rhomboid family serine protease